MAFELTEELKEIINNKSTVAVVSAVGKNGNPYSAVGLKLEIRKDGRLGLYSLLETSQLQKNLVFSIWFDKEVSISLIAKDGRNFQLYVKPYQALIAGREFEAAYETAIAEFGEDADLSTVWLLDLVSAKESTYKVEKEIEKKAHPYLGHYDHIPLKEGF